MANYDPKVIQEFADKLYKKASSIIATYTILGLVIGGVGGYFLAPQAGPIFNAIAAVLFALLGFAIGREKSFMIKLQAQTSLCQMKIEQNTSGKSS